MDSCLDEEHEERQRKHGSALATRESYLYTVLSAERHVIARACVSNKVECVTPKECERSRGHNRNRCTD